MYLDTINLIKQNVDTATRGNYNCIPNPIGKFKPYIPGIYKGQMITITAGTGVGKSQFTKYLCLEAVKFAVAKKYKLKIVWFALEETKTNFTLSIMSNRLSKEGILKSPLDLMSYTGTLDKDVLDILIKNERYFEIFDSYVKVIDDIFDVDSIISYINKIGEASDPDTHYLFVLDHLSLIEGSESRHANMQKYSEYFRKIASKKYNFSSIIVQQQSADSESTENFKYDRMEPSLTNLADNRLVARDAMLIYGLFAPKRYNLKRYDNFSENEIRTDLRSVMVLKNRDGLATLKTYSSFDGYLNFTNYIV